MAASGSWFLDKNINLQKLILQANKQNLLQAYGNENISVIQAPPVAPVQHKEDDESVFHCEQQLKTQTEALISPPQERTSGSSSKANTEDDNTGILAFLIEEVRQYPCLWDTHCRSFKETPKKNEAWQRISKKLQFDGMYPYFFCMVIENKVEEFGYFIYIELLNYFLLIEEFV